MDYFADGAMTRKCFFMDCFVAMLIAMASINMLLIKDEYGDGA